MKLYKFSDAYKTVLSTELTVLGQFCIKITARLISDERKIMSHGESVIGFYIQFAS